MKCNVHNGIKRSGNSVSRGRHFCRTIKDSKQAIRFEGGMCLSGRFSGAPVVCCI